MIKKNQIARRIGVLLDWQMTAPKQVDLTNSFLRNDWHLISFDSPVNVTSIYIQVRYKDLN